jgi:hypothetical protein
VVPDSASESDESAGGAGSGFNSALFETALVDGVDGLAMAVLEDGVPFEGGVFGMGAGLSEDFVSWPAN